MSEALFLMALAQAQFDALMVLQMTWHHAAMLNAARPTQSPTGNGNALSRAIGSGALMGGIPAIAGFDARNPS